MSTSIDTMLAQYPRAVSGAEFDMLRFHAKLAVAAAKKAKVDAERVTRDHDRLVKALLEASGTASPAKALEGCGAAASTTTAADGKAPDEHPSSTAVAESKPSGEAVVASGSDAPAAAPPSSSSSRPAGMPLGPGRGRGAGGPPLGPSGRRGGGLLGLSRRDIARNEELDKVRKQREAIEARVHADRRKEEISRLAALVTESEPKFQEAVKQAAELEGRAVELASVLSPDHYQLVDEYACSFSLKVAPPGLPPIHFQPAVHTDETELILEQQISQVLPEYQLFRDKVDTLITDLKERLSEEQKELEKKRQERWAAREAAMEARRQQRLAKTMQDQMPWAEDVTATAPVVATVAPQIPRIRHPAPHFETDALLPDGTFGRSVLSDYTIAQGKWVILLFYPFDFSRVCPTELLGFNAAHEEFERLGCQLLSVSGDSNFVHLAWRGKEGGSAEEKKDEKGEGGTAAPTNSNSSIGPLRYPMLSDVSGAMARDYGMTVCDPTDKKMNGASLRGLFLIDPKGALRHYTINDGPVARSVEEALRVLQAFQYVDGSTDGAVAPCGWQPIVGARKRGREDEDETVEPSAEGGVATVTLHADPVRALDYFAAQAEAK